MLSKTAISTFLAASMVLAIPAFAQDAATDDAATDDAATGDAATGDAMAGDAATDDAATGEAATDDAMAGDAMAGDAAVPELAEASMAIDAATAAGLVELLVSGEAYTAFVPTNDALAAVQDAATEAMGDEAAFSTLIQGYVVEGTVMAADAMTMVTDEGGTHEATSLAGTPLTLAMDGETLTVNGAAVTTPDLMLGNVVIHIIDTAFLPES